MEAAEWFEAEVRKLRAFLVDVVRGSGGDVGAALSESRKDFQYALSNFFAQSQYLISLHVAIYTAAIAVLYFVMKESPDRPYALLHAGGALLFVSVPVSRRARIVMRNTYELYAASVIYSCQLHRAVGADTHRWFEYVDDGLRTVLRRTGAIPRNQEELLEAWTSHDRANIVVYDRLVLTMMWISAIAGLGFVVVGVIG